MMETMILKGWENAEMKKALQELRKVYGICKEASEKNYRESLKEGQTIVKHDSIIDEKSRETFSRFLDEMKSAFINAIGESQKDIASQLYKAPSQDATNALMMLKLRENITAEDIDQLMNLYGSDNAYVYETLRDIAIHHDFHDFKVNKLVEKRNGLEQLQKNVERYLDIRAIQNDTDISAVEFGLMADVDQAYPV